MNFNSQKYSIRWVIIRIIIGATLIGCSIPYHAAILISSINDSNCIMNTDPAIRVAPKNKPIISVSKNIFFNDQKKIINNVTYPERVLELKTSIDNRIIYNRNYDNIQKGSYDDNTYTVKRGDTLFYISRIIGDNYLNLTRFNKITEPFRLNIEKKLNINSSSVRLKKIIANRATNTNNTIIDSWSINACASSGDEQHLGKVFSRKTKILTLSKLPSEADSSTLNSKSVVKKAGKWLWPTKGKVIESFSDTRGGNKGCDISGSRRQPIFSTAAGKVVYSGNALRGYGNLIIIKHNHDYLSAYAHNDTILVRDQQEVQAGQKIATMGSTGTSSVRLHFEIRYKGKSVNPLRFLSQ